MYLKKIYNKIKKIFLKGRKFVKWLRTLLNIATANCNSAVVFCVYKNVFFTIFQ